MKDVVVLGCERITGYELPDLCASIGYKFGGCTQQATRDAVVVHSQTNPIVLGGERVSVNMDGADESSARKLIIANDQILTSIAVEVRTDDGPLVKLATNAHQERGVGEPISVEVV